MEPVTLGVLAVAAIAGSSSAVADRQLSSGLQLMLKQIIGNRLPRNDDVALVTRRAQMLALRLCVRRYEHLTDAKRHITQPLNGLTRRALLDRNIAPQRAAQLKAIKALEKVLSASEPADGLARPRQGALRRLAEDWTLAEARLRVSNQQDWRRFETVVKEPGVSLPGWWDAFRALVSEEIKNDMRLASVFAQPSLVEMLGPQGDLRSILADLASGQDEWRAVVRPTLVAARAKDLKGFDHVIDERATPPAPEPEAEAPEPEPIEVEPEESEVDQLARRAGETVANANQLTSVGQVQEAIAATSEAIELYRELTFEDRDRFLPPLTTALGALGVRLFRAGEFEDAAMASRQSIDLLRELSARDRAQYLPELASALNSLSHRFANAGQHEEALPLAAEAAALRRELAAKDTAYAEAFARACGSHAYSARALERTDEALVAFKEGIEALNPLMPTATPALSKLYVSLVKELADTLDAIGRMREARALREQIRA